MKELYADIGIVVQTKSHYFRIRQGFVVQDKSLTNGNFLLRCNIDNRQLIRTLSSTPKLSLFNLSSTIIFLANMHRLAAKMLKYQITQPILLTLVRRCIFIYTLY